MARLRFASLTAALLARAAGVTALLLLGVAAGATAATLLDIGYGTPAGGATARSLAMGSTGIALRQGSDALFLNPALLVPAAGRVELDVTAGAIQANEERLYPIFDSFNGYQTETIVATNRNTYGSAAGGIAWRLPSAHPIALGAGVFDRFGFDYDYFEEVRDPSGDDIQQEREIAVDGCLRSISFGCASEVVRDVQLGLVLHRYTGEPSATVRTANLVTQATTTREIRQPLDGWGWSVGAWGRAGERIDLGVSFEGPFQVDGAFASRTQGTGSAIDSTASRALDYPGTLRFGVAYHPRNELRTRFAVEFERRFWETLDETQLDVFGDSLAVRDTWDFRVGLEHLFYNGLPLRFGFRYLENYADPESGRTVFSVGVGYRVAGIALDATGLYSRQTSRQGFPFPAPAPGTEKVEDTVLQLLFGASRAF
jgi:hypothetical protein